MIEVATYVSQNAKPNERWLAYVILPDGSQWLVRFTGETEEIARSKALRLYESEVAKRKAHVEPDEEVNVSQSSDRRGQHFAGKAWLIHKQTRVKIRVPIAEVESYLGEYERGGPRSR
jgi:hypothetical protein